MDDKEKQIIESSLDKVSKRRLPVTRAEIADVVAKAEADSTRLTLNAITENTKAVSKFLKDKVEVEASLTLPEKPLKAEVTNEIVVKNLKDLKIPEPKIELTTEKYEINQQEVDLTPVTKAIRDIPRPETTI